MIQLGFVLIFFFLVSMHSTTWLIYGLNIVSTPLCDCTLQFFFFLKAFSFETWQKDLVVTHGKVNHNHSWRRWKQTDQKTYFFYFQFMLSFYLIRAYLFNRHLVFSLLQSCFYKWCCSGNLKQYIWVYFKKYQEEIMRRTFYVPVCLQNVDSDCQADFTA